VVDREDLPIRRQGAGGLLQNRSSMKTHRAFIMAAFLVCAAALPTASTAAGTKAPPDTPTAAEQPFVTKATHDINASLGTTAAATKAGYFRYNDEDDTGAISWIDLKCWTSTEACPNQVWYDVKGNLLGVDYTVPYTDKSHPPHLWGILPARWQDYGSHTHFAIRQADGSLKYDYALDKQIKSVGGDPAHPTAANIVALHKAKSTSDVAFVFPVPESWDLEFWVDGNPKGAFAYKNPNVVPSHASHM
jgi:hypothetical protein